MVSPSEGKDQRGLSSGDVKFSPTHNGNGIFRQHSKTGGVGRRVRAVMPYRIGTWAEGGEPNTEDHTEAEKNVFSDQGQIGWCHLLKGRISADWAAVINTERIENGLQVHPQANVKVIREIISIVIDLWRQRCEIAYGKTKKERNKSLGLHMRSET